MRIVFTLLLIYATPIAAQEPDTFLQRNSTAQPPTLQLEGVAPSPDAKAQILEVPSLTFSSPAGITFSVNTCNFAVVVTMTKEVSINWKCVEEYAAKSIEPFGYNSNFQAWAIMLKAVRDGTYKDVTP